MKMGTKKLLSLCIANHSRPVLQKKTVECPKFYVIKVLIFICVKLLPWYFSVLAHERIKLLNYNRL
jgi:hypothetical protein